MISVKDMFYTMLFLLILLNYSCNKSEISGLKAPNSLPDTYLANIPPQNTPDQLYSFRLTFSWDGRDEDGVIVGFYYRYDDMEWTFTDKRSGTFSFKSPDSINYHQFSVKAVDNDGAEDPTPDTRAFYTCQNQNPHTEIISGPAEGEELFMLPEITETWQGLEIRFKGTDDDGTISGYEYTVDDTTKWTFIENDFIRLTQVNEGEHKFYVRAIDDAQGKDLTPAMLMFRAVIATFDAGILVIDETRDGQGSSKASPSDEQVDQFYTDVLMNAGRSFTEWDLADQGLPTALDIAPFSLIIWHTDDRVKQEIRSSIKLLKDYLNVGGKLWITGWRVIPEIDVFIGAEFHSYESGEFGRDYLHLKEYNEQSEFDFIGARGVNGFPNIEVDNEKLLSSYDGMLNFIGIMIPIDCNLSEPILTFKSAINSSFDGQPCGIRIINNNLKIIVFSFPLYFMNPTHTSDVMEKVLSDLNE